MNDNKKKMGAPKPIRSFIKAEGTFPVVTFCKSHEKKHVLLGWVIFYAFLYFRIIYFTCVK